MAYWKTMGREEISALCAKNEAIAKAWGELAKRRDFPIIKNKVVEMHSNAHFVKNVDEVSVIFKAGSRLNKYVIETREDGTKFTLYENVA